MHAREKNQRTEQKTEHFSRIYHLQRNISHAKSRNLADWVIHSMLSCALQTSLYDESYWIRSGVDELKCIHVTHAVCLVTIDTQDSVVYLTTEK